MRKETTALALRKEAEELIAKACKKLRPEEAWEWELAQELTRQAEAMEASGDRGM